MSLVVTRAVGLVTIQDFGRPGHMHVGLSPGGALVPDLLVAANRRAQNPDNAAAIEVMGTVTVRADTPIVVATDLMSAHELRAGEQLTLVSERHRATYLAVRGGIDAPIMLGSRSTQLSAGLGSLLRAGTQLHVGDAPVVIHPVHRFADEGPIRLMSGPDAGAFTDEALPLLVSATWTVSASSNRVGTRLGGPSLPRTNRPEATRPMVRGAIEVPGDGQPIVLGPEFPVTGGYPVIAVIASADLARFFATPVGRSVRFVVA